MQLEYLISTSNDVYYNLALEEFIVRNIDLNSRNLLLIYINDTSVVLGKNQNILREIFYPNYLENQIKVARRISGGGTVVHDRGNINFAFFEAMDFKKVNSYLSSTQRLSDIINQLGVKTYLNSRSGIFLPNDKKIGGSAQFSCSNGILSHFTILYNSDLDQVNQILMPNSYMIKTKSSESVSSPVDNLCNYLEHTQEEFIYKVLNILEFKTEFDFNLINQSEVEKLKTEKYGNQDFIYSTGNHGFIEKGSIVIELSNGNIKDIHGIDKPDEYLNKRLIYNDISSENILWDRLLS